jgi:DNA polymerase-1
LKRILFDLESDGFLEECTKVHCIAAADVDTGERWDWKPGELPSALELLDQADVLIGHNIQRFDIPVLTKLHGFKPRKYPAVLDTMIIARLIFPNVRDTDAELVVRGQMPKGKDYIGKHTLGAWGYRLGEHKTEYDGGFEVWTEIMHHYMVQDVTTNLRLWKHLNVEAYSQAAVELEHRITYVCDQMEKCGVPFDVEAAGRLHAELIAKKAEAEAKLVEAFGSWLAPIAPKELETPFVPKRDNPKRGYVAGAPLTRLKLVTFNPGSRDHIAKVLTELGWKPKEFTEGGKPKVDENVVASAAIAFPQAAPLADYLMVDKRLSQLADGDQAWLKAVKPDGCIHGVINPMGTTTSRAAHFNPNLGQVPAAKSPYGHECRSLFGKRKGWKLVGADQEGLELRGFSHYLKPLDDGAYEKIVLDGDPHWANVLAMGLLPEGTVRDKDSQLHKVCREAGAKRFIYAFIYGCGDEKAGSIVLDAALAADKLGDQSLLKRFFLGKRAPGVVQIKKVGKAIRKGFLEKTGGLQALKRRLEGYDNVSPCGDRQHVKGFVDIHGYVPGLDGRRIPSRASHSSLNFLIQSAGAILCKRWVCDAFDELESRYKLGDDFAFYLWVHDEIQVGCREDIADEVGAVLVKHAKRAGEPYGFRVPLDSSYSVGDTWADTH